MGMTAYEAFIQALGASKSYTNKTIEGAGALKGKNCTIKSIIPIEGGNRVTFEWTLDNGTVETDTMDVMNGEDGNDGSIVVYTQTLQSGTKIGEITIDGTKTNIFAPSGGGGGSSALSELTDVDLSTLSDGDVLVYDNTEGKWVNESPEDGALVEAVLSKSVMPTASAEYEDIVVLYIGTTSATYTKGHLYLCVENSGSYSWTDITPSGSGSTFAQFEVTTSGWTADTTSQSGSTLYKKAIPVTSVSSTFGVVSIGSTGTLPTVAQQTAFDLVQYVTIDSTVPCLYLYASAIPTDSFYIKVEGVA